MKRFGCAIGCLEIAEVYAYAHDDPTDNEDPTGLAAYDCSGGLGKGNCIAGTVVSAGDTVKTTAGTFSIAQKPAFAIATRISDGPNNRLTDKQVTSIVFNETRSLSGESAQTARTNVAQAVINGDERLGSNRPVTASSNVPFRKQRKTCTPRQQRLSL
jgi:hypothetical protein